MRFRGYHTKEIAAFFLFIFFVIFLFGLLSQGQEISNVINEIEATNNTSLLIKVNYNFQTAILFSSLMVTCLISCFIMITEVVAEKIEERYVK